MARAKTKRAEIIGPGGVPIRKHEKAYDFNKAIQLWVGPPKTGKTSTAAALGTVAEEYGLEKEINPFFMLFEPGSGGVELNCTSENCHCSGKDKECPDCNGSGLKRKILTTLDEMDEWFDWAAKSEFNPIVLDTGDAMWQAIADGVCLRMGITNPTESDHGIAWFQIFDELREKLAVLVGAGKGLIIIMHVYLQERRVRGGSIQTATFNVSGKSRGYIAGLANQILFFSVDPDGDRDKYNITSKAQAGIEAGDHWGIFPDELDRGDTPEEGAKRILGCFGYDFEG